MDFVENLKLGGDNLLAYINDRIYPFQIEQRNNFDNMVESLEQKFNFLLSDEDNDKPEFLVPELPKPKKDMKARSKLKVSEISKKRETQKQDVRSSSVDCVDASDTVRKSSRLASKTSQIPKQVVPVAIQTPLSTEIVCNKTFTVIPNSMLPPPCQLPLSNESNSIITSKSTDVDDCLKNTTESVKWTTAISEPSSPSMPPTKMRCIESINSGKSNNMFNDSSFKPSLRDEPLGSSTPTIMPPETLQKVHRTPKQLDTAKKPKLKTNIFTEQSVSAAKGAKTRNQDKILQEKSTNIKMIEEKCQEAQKKKEDIIKSSAEEAKRKREERTRKAAATREAALLEKSKQMQKQESVKDMKSKQTEKHKDEKLRLESQKKKQVAAIKQVETEKRKRDEEDAKLPKLKKTDPKSEIVVEYAIDDVIESGSSDEEEHPKKRVPNWATKANRKRPLLIQGYLNKKDTIRPWFFNPILKYPKLETLFPGVNLKNRPRASSAFWNTIVDFEEAFPLHD